MTKLMQVLAVASSVGVPALVFWMLPVWSRPQTCFGVTVDPGFRLSEAGRDIRRRYRLRIGILTLLAAALWMLGMTRGAAAWVLGGVLVQVAGPLWAVARANADTRPHAVPPGSVREAVLEPRRIVVPGGLVARAGPYVLLAAAALVLVLRWEAIPERFAIHWGADGQPNGWMNRTPIGVFAPLLLGAFICGLLDGLGRWTQRASRAPSGMERAQVATILQATGWFIAIVSSLAALATALTIPHAPLLVVAVSLGGTAGLLLLVARSASRVASSRRAHATSPASPGDGTPDSRWKWGLFYCNPDDPALFVPRRFGIGYDLNFGHRAAWVCLALVLATIGAFVVAMELLGS